MHLEYHTFKYKSAKRDHDNRYTNHFSGWIPFAVRPRIYNLPFSTSPKFADADTAMRESKNGEYFTA